MKLSTYIQNWYDTYRKPRQQRNTQIIFENLIRNHIVKKQLGDMYMSTITTEDIQQFLNNQLANGNITRSNSEQKALSCHTVIRIRQILVAVFKRAVFDNIVQYNIAEHTTLPPVPWQDHYVFTPDMQHKILDALKNDRYYLAYILLFFLGCRRSEILGLSWNCVDLKRNILKIQQVLVLENNIPVLRARTKTKASIRTIPFPKEIKAMLSDWRNLQKKEARSKTYSNTNKLVFTDIYGNCLNPTLFSRNFKNTLKKLKIDKKGLHLHSIRHTWATNMLQYGIPIPDVQYLGGWSRPETLLNIYAHTVKDSQRKAINTLFKELY